MDLQTHQFTLQQAARQVQLVRLADVGEMPAPSTFTPPATSVASLTPRYPRIVEHTALAFLVFSLIYVGLAFTSPSRRRGSPLAP
jgi:hypothetical protein